MNEFYQGDFAGYNDLIQQNKLMGGSFNKRHINQFWYSIDHSGNLPSFYYDSVELILRQGYTPILWTYQKLKNIPNGVVVKDANKIIPYRVKSTLFDNNNYLSKKKESLKTNKKYFDVAIFSDLFRAKLLKDHGGIYFDTDVLLLKKLPNIRNTISTIPRKLEGLQVRTKSLTKFHEADINSSVMIAEKGSKWITTYYNRIMDRMEEAHIKPLKNNTDLLNMLSQVIKDENVPNIVAPPIAYNPIPYWTYQMKDKPFFSFGYKVPSIKQIKENSYTLSLSGIPLKNHYKELLEKLDIKL